MTLANQHRACEQWQASSECDDKSEFVVWQIRACGDKSASGAWQIQTTCESNTLCLSHLLVNRPAGWSPTKCRCNNVSVCPACNFKLFESEHQDCIGIAILSSKTFTRYTHNPDTCVDPNILVEKLWGEGWYLEAGASSSTTGLWHLYTVLVQFYSPHWN